MAMSDNKSNVCGLKQCGNINYMFQSQYWTVYYIYEKNPSYTLSLKHFLLGCIQIGKNVEQFSSYAINLINGC